ncbi:MAG: MAPEG family protein, partial [Hyphomonadaceae bacterium]|nr:MAPEG family protein [Hyphomonadaceae bacterium]
MLRLEVAALYAGVNILILLVLAVLVVAGRRKHKITLGDGNNEAFGRAVRAHGNAAEYIPAGLVGITLLALFDP